LTPWQSMIPLNFPWLLCFWNSCLVCDLPVNVLIKVSLTRLIHSVHRPFVRSDLGHLVLSPCSAHHSIRCHLLWVWLCGVDASDPVCVHPSLQLWRTHVANSVQQVRVHLYNLKLSFSIHLTLNMTSPQVVETSVANNSSFQN